MKIETNASSFWLRSFGVAAASATLLLTAGGCKSKAAQAPITNASDISQDPADSNLATPVGYTSATQGGARVLNASASYSPQQSSQAYPQQNYPDGQQPPAPIVRGTPNQQAPAYYDNGQQGAAYPDNGQQPAGDYSYNNPQIDNSQQYDSTEQAGEEAIAQTDQAPPPLPEYDQPPAPEDNDMWTPGYWAWGSYGYYWVPGVWVAPPYYGALWTPPYWGWYGGHYWFHHGYWGPHVGFYGGVDYGFGYIGFGYFGGYWSGNRFFYNRAVTVVNPSFVHNVYDRPVIYNNVHYSGRIINRVAYNGGPGGLRIAPRPAEMAALREVHTRALPEQRQFREQVAQNRSFAYTQNHGRPPQAAFNRAVGNPRAIGATPPHAAAAIENRNATLQGRGTGMNGAVQQRNASEGQRGPEGQQRNNLEQQRGNPQAQRGAEFQQRNNPEQQRNTEQQRNFEQQRQQQPANTPQQQPRNFEQQRSQPGNAPQQQQRNFEQQRQQQPANTPQQQPRNFEQQRQQPGNVPQQQQPRNFEQQRPAQQPGNVQQQPPHNFQQAPRPGAEPRVQQRPQEQPRSFAQPQAVQQAPAAQQARSFEQPRVQEQPRMQEQPRVQEQPRNFSQPRAEQSRVESRPAAPAAAPHPAPAPHPSGGGGGRPEGGRPH